MAIHAPVCRAWGLFYNIERGISLGCPLSPLMGALFLQTLDERMEQLGLFYLRYMDDIVVLCQPPEA